MINSEIFSKFFFIISYNCLSKREIEGNFITENGNEEKSVKQKIKVMAEFSSSGLWGCGPDLYAGLSSKNLGISEKLRNRIDAWIDEYGSWLDWDDPGHSPPIPTERLKKFNEEGLKISELVQQDLAY